jgi:branched-chain amino acid transport system permease protein
MTRRSRAIPASTPRAPRSCCSWSRALAAAATGAILAPRYVYIEPSLAFSPMLSFQVVIMALLGGPGRLWGPLVGVIPFTFLWEAISSSFPNQTTLVLGLTFLVIVYALPRGFVGLLEDGRLRLRSREGYA